MLSLNLFNVRRMVPTGVDASQLPSSGEMVKRYITVALPSVCEMVLISLINMMDTVMVSGIGTDAVAAVGLVGQPRMILLSIFFALNVGITAVVARRKGENDREEANRVMRNAIVIITILSFLVMGAVLPFAVPLMRFAGAEEGRTLGDSVTYFLILGGVLPLNVLSMAICAAQRGIGNTKLTMYVNITSNLVNILCNWLLINGIGPFPKLGVTGAAIATDIGLLVGFVLSLLSLFGGKKNDSFLRLSLRDSWKLSKRSLSDVVKIALSAMVEQLAMRFGFFSYAKIVAGLGTDAFAAHQIASQFLGLSFSAADGLGIAGTSLVGQSLGMKRKDMAHAFGKLAARFSTYAGLLIAVMCIFGRSLLVSVFIASEDGLVVRQMAETLMIVVGLIQPFQMESVVVAGALRGAGDVKYTARVMALTVALMRPVLAFASVKLMPSVGIALTGAWCASLIDLVLRAVLFTKRYNTGRWADIRV